LLLFHSERVVIHTAGRGFLEAMETVWFHFQGLNVHKSAVKQLLFLPITISFQDMYRSLHYTF
jgi:hypothetical protein